MSYQIAAIPVTLVEVLWDRLLPHIQRVVDIAPDELTVEKIKERSLTADIVLTTISKGSNIIGVITLEIRTFDTGIRALYLPVIGGNEMFDWMDQYLDVAHAIAKDFNCQQIRGLAARKGWMRVLKDKGFEEVYTAVKCEVRS